MNVFKLAIWAELDNPTFLVILHTSDTHLSTRACLGAGAGCKVAGWDLSQAAMAASGTWHGRTLCFGCWSTLWVERLDLHHSSLEDRQGVLAHWEMGDTQVSFFPCVDLCQHFPFGFKGFAKASIVGEAGPFLSLLESYASHAKKSTGVCLMSWCRSPIRDQSSVGREYWHRLVEFVSTAS